MVKKTTAKGFSEETFVDVSKAKEAVSIFKKYLQHQQESEENKSSTKRKGVAGDEQIKKKAKIALEDVDNGDSNEPMIPNCVMLDVSLKKIPLNSSVYVHCIGPLPHPWRFESSNVDICLIVKDPDPKKPLKDRDLDLEQTRNIYRKKLEEAGFDEDFLNHRLVILPMRQLLTEYTEYEAKGNLVNAYDVFLADKTLMRSKESGLNTFLGKKFWFDRKKIPIPVNLKLEKQDLQQEIKRALDSTEMPVTGRGQKMSVRIGSVSQSPKELAENLVTVLSTVKEIYGKNVRSLSLRSNRGSHFSLPFFLDNRSANEVTEDEICPRRTKTIEEETAFKVPKSVIIHSD